MKKVAIIGLGLIGGSLGLAFKTKFPGYRVMGLSRSRAKIRLAKRKRVIDEGSLSARKVLAEADLVFISTPVSAIPFWIAQCEKYCQIGTLVTDVGSTKQTILQWTDTKHFRKIHFVGSHPMAGSHRTGLGFARADLFEDSITLVTRTSRTNPKALKALLEIWKKVSRHVVVLDPARHDQIMAEISHAPHAVAAILVRNASQDFLRYAAQGFLDTTRIAQGDPILWRDIFTTNRTHLIGHLRRFRSSLNYLMDCLRRGQSSKIYRFLHSAAKIRKVLSSSH